jgi:hypothetical protein
MCNGTSFEKWQADVIKKILSIENTEASLLIIDDNIITENKLLKKLNTLKRILSKNFLFYIYLKFIHKTSNTETVDLTTTLKDSHKIFCKTEKKGKFSEYFYHNDIEQIKKYELDFVLRFGFNIIRGEVLNLPKYGVWSFHHDDESKYRGSPPAFWEVYFNEPKSGAILQRLTDKLDGGIILKKGFIKTSLSYSKNLNNILNESTEWPMQMCIDIQNGNTGKFFVEPSTTDAKIYYAPTNLDMIKFSINTIRKVVKAKKNQKKFIDTWKIGIINDFTLEDLLFCKEYKFTNIKWLNEFDMKNFKADCFLILKNNLTYVFYEGFDNLINKGFISLIVLDDQNNVLRDKVLLKESFHLSYPSIIENNGIVYCIPESHENNEISIYEFNFEDEELTNKKILLSNIDAVDTTVLYHDNIWWMFYSLESRNADNKLYIRYSDDLFGSWIEHPKNPVKTDVSSSRPAGNIFQYKNELYRPSQNSEITYGGSITINKITTLTKTDYEEISVKVIDKNNFNEDIDGVHTINFQDNKLIIDVKRRINK